MNEELQKRRVHHHLNYDGRYTPKSIQRHIQAEIKQNPALDKYKSAKPDYKSRPVSKQLAKNSQNCLKTAKLLSKDYLADQAKELYVKGKAIIENILSSKDVPSATNIVLSSTNAFLNHIGKGIVTKYGNIPIGSKSSSVIALGGGVISGILAEKDYQDISI